jgi:hypothetical protein
MMKKLFIGCGILVLLILGVLGYAVYQVYPDAKEWQSRWTTAIAQLEVLDQSHPFEAAAQTELDNQRFVQVLDLRVELVEYLRGTLQDLESVGAEGEDGEELGVIETFKVFFRATREPPIVFSERLTTAGMGPTEFSWHTKVLWACLRRVDQGAGEPGLSELRGRFDEFETFYEKQRKHNDDLPVLSDLIGEVPQAVIAQASAILISDIQRVHDGLYAPELDHLYLMLPIQEIDDLGLVVEPGGGVDPADR